jgi:hypothetical protein
VTEKKALRSAERRAIEHLLKPCRAFLAAAINGNAKAFVPKLAQLFENQQKVLEEEARKKRYREIAISIENRERAK